MKPNAKSALTGRRAALAVLSVTAAAWWGPARARAAAPAQPRLRLHVGARPAAKGPLR